MEIINMRWIYNVKFMKMTTITINQKIKLSKTHFLNIEELMQELINLYNLSNSNQKK
jgi:hypothetical protein